MLKRNVFEADESGPSMEILVYDLVNAAIHEAGHIVLARHFGARVVDAEMGWRPEALGNMLAEYTIRASVFCEQIECGRSLIGLAGVVAEAIFSDGDLLSGELLIEWIEGGILEPSPSDWESIEVLTEDLAQDCIDILMARWPEVVASAIECISGVAAHEERYQIGPPRLMEACRIATARVEAGASPARE